MYRRGVWLSALFGCNCFDAGGAILVVIVLKVEPHCLNDSLVNAGAECAEGTSGICRIVISGGLTNPNKA